MVTMKEITDDEAALYDRQIRLWGVDAQRSLRSANVFVKGIGPLGAEICKNIVLSGVNTLAVQDTRIVTKEHLATTFLIRNSTGKSFSDTAVPNLQILNPLVDVKSVSEDLTQENIHNYTVVCVTDSNSVEYTRINELCRANNVIFLASNTWGMTGFMFQDCGEYTYVEEVVKKTENKSGDVQKVKRRKLEEEEEWQEKTVTFSSFQHFLNARLMDPRRTSEAFFSSHAFLNDKSDISNHCKELLESYNLPKDKVDEELVSNLEGTLVPICAIVGGVVSQEIIKLVSKKDAPMMNSFFYNGLTGAGIIEHLS